MMRRTIILSAALFAAAALSAQKTSLADFAKGVEWTGQNSLIFRDGGKGIAIDPWGLKADIAADVVLITHGHTDHFSVADLSKAIVTGKTRIYGPEEVVYKLKASYGDSVAVVRPGDSFEVAGLKVECVRAYNVKRSHHPKAMDWMGFVIDFGGIRAYVTGDTELIPEMDAISCDVIFLPMGQTYTFVSVEDAAEAARRTKAKLAVPVHWGVYEGKAADVDAFKTLLKGQIEVVVLERK